MEINNMRSVVLDVGSMYTKAGFSGEIAARKVLRSCVGTPRHSGGCMKLFDPHTSDYIAGNEAFSDRGLLNLQWPVRCGNIVDFESYEYLLYHTLYRSLEVVPDTTPLLLIQSTTQSHKHRERVAEILFETFSIPLLGMLNDSTATVYSTGRTTGIAVDSGAGKTLISAVCDSYPLAHTQRLSPIAGEVLTQELFSALRKKGYPLSTKKDWAIVEGAKETLCRVLREPGGDRNALSKHMDVKVRFTLPDNEHIFLFEHEVLLGEKLFDASLVSQMPLQVEGMMNIHGDPTGYSLTNPACVKPFTGWASVIDEVITAAPDVYKEMLYSNIVLGGGTTLLRDVEIRLQKELAQRAKPSVVRVVAFHERAQAAWLGGSVWASSPSYPSLCLSKANYFEGGSSSVHHYAC